ncbi:MAG: helix-turn-helix domain-containing protein [Clostridia bacterium]|nr:helix-turn-helix domain-containing protein [Clostridia bacterium]
MDMIKMGSFLAELRKDHNLTQAELGEKLGVSNKTISRWETGTYMPPVEMLEQLSNMYDLTINELLSGSKLSTEDYKMMAEVNIKETMKENVVISKIRSICSFFWRRCFIFIPILLAAFFGLGYFREFNKLIYEDTFYEDLSDEMIRRISVEAGCTVAIINTIIVLLVVFVITLILAKRKSVTSESKDLKKLKLIRKIFIAPYIVSLIICAVFSFIGVGDFMLSSGVDFGLEGFTDAAFVLAFYFWWLYIICFIGIIVTSIMIMKKNND